MLASPVSRTQPHHHHGHTESVRFARQSTCSRHNGMADHSVTASAPKKPKLSLQTSSLPITFGKSSTGLTVTASAVDNATPTHFNTFTNAYSIPHRPSPTATPPVYRSSTPLSARNISPTLSRKPSQPYSLSHPLGLKSILRNSPIPRPLRCITNSASPATARRVFFPPIKRVTFRQPDQLVEVIHTTTYVAAHADLSSSESGSEGEWEDVDEAPVSATNEADADADVDADIVSDVGASRKRKCPASRQIEAVELREGRPTVRLYSSKRKRRRWEWTLTPSKVTENGVAIPTEAGDVAVAMAMPVAPSDGQAGQGLTCQTDGPTGEDQERPHEQILSPAEIALPASPGRAWDADPDGGSGLSQAQPLSSAAQVEP